MLHILCCGFTTEIRRVMVDRSPMMLGEFKRKHFFSIPMGRLSKNTYRYMFGLFGMARNCHCSERCSSRIESYLQNHSAVGSWVLPLSDLRFEHSKRWDRGDSKQPACF
jgi:hypothetical protein